MIFRDNVEFAPSTIILIYYMEITQSRHDIC